MRAVTLGRIVAVSLVLAAAWLGGASAAAACSCEIDPITNELLLPDADVIFQGKVVSDPEPTTVDLGNGNGPTWPMSRYRVRVDRYYKGRLGRHIYVLTAAPNSGCGFHWERGSYLVYAGLWEDGTPEVHLCSATAPLSQSEEALAALGDGIAPDRSLDVREGSEESGGCSVSVPGSNAGTRAAAIAAASLLGLASLRRRVRNAR
jgi:MYXO-CTERM domain-containing protein